MANSISEKILQFIQSGDMAEFDDGVFNQLALELFQQQFEKNVIYRVICQQQKIVPQRISDWREIPAVTTSAFKEVPLICFPPPEAVAVFHTSGTTQQRSGKHYFRTLDFYRTAMLRSFAAYCLEQQVDITPSTSHATWQAPSRAVIPEESCYNLKQSSEMKKDSSAMTFPLHVARNAKMRMFFLGPTAEHFPNSSLGYMFSGIRDEFGDEASAAFFLPNQIQVQGFENALERARAEGTPVFILGTALGLLECMEVFQQQDRKFQLPAQSRILDTGGYKSRRLEVSREEFQHRLGETFGVPAEYLLNEYGMTELSSQFYAGSLAGIPSRQKQPNASLHALRFTSNVLHFLPPWTRVVAVDPENLRVLPEGQAGLLRIFDLANVDSVMAIQTEDWGRAWQDRLELIGRATGAELRGCSLLTDAIAHVT